MPHRFGPHDSPDAFMLMRYEGAGGRREWIWNSRDGVTPFIVWAQDDETVEMQHGNWHLDRYEPRYVPPVGSRVFVDMTEELARPLAVEHVERHWGDPQLPMRVHPTFAALGKAGTVEHVVKRWMADSGGHAPHLIVVSEALHAQFKARAEAPSP